MERIDLEVRGPISHAIVNRRRRIVRSAAAPAAVAGALYAALATEPSIAGLWAQPDGDRVRIHQVGQRVTGFFEESGSRSFVAYFVSANRLEGTLYGRWIDIEPGDACFEDVATDPTFSALVDWDAETISQRWTASINPETCVVTYNGNSSSQLERVY